jgi:CheY-like chemotaxis protein
MLERLIGEDITLRLHLGAGLPKILADQGLLEQMLLNLAITCRDSMPSGGNLTIRSSYIARGERSDLPAGWEKGAVALRVEDTGRGISPEDLPHIFEPFFKTRNGVETALRLATVYGIVQQHAARVEVQSEFGLGTRFEILFPALALPQDRKPEAPPEHADDLILIVEDSSDLRSLIRDLLLDEGYASLDAPSCAAALQLFESSRDRIALVIADVCLEDGSGRELVRRLRAMKPGIKAVITTGYDPHQALSKMALEPGESFLAKPFQTEDLLKAIASLLRR